MKRFAALIDRLIYTRSRNSKLALIVDYLRHTPDPDRGWAIAALTESLDFPAVKAGTVRALLATRVDEELFRLSRHFVGDTAETAALLWPDASGQKADLSVSEAVDALAATSRSDAPAVVASLLDRLDADGRYALLKLALGGMRVGVVGFGGIGRAFAGIAAALGMHVHAWDRSPHPDLTAVAGPQARWVGLEELLSTCDAVSVHLPLTPQTRGLLTAELLDLLRPGTILVNTARGELFAPGALAARL